MKFGELFRLLKNEGWTTVRKSGSHVIMENPDKVGRIIIPFHAGKEVKKGLLKSIIKQAGIKNEKR